VQPPRIAQAPVAFECVLHETLETESRYVFIGRVQWLAVREGLVDTEKWRVRLQEFFPWGVSGPASTSTAATALPSKPMRAGALALSATASTVIDEM
jgi:flavin reductase (DIM6/NTAB) family NADH-FMN oxidoreductase RutF